jgi:hypothetical protein
VADAEEAVDQLAAVSADHGWVISEVWTLRLHALLALAHGDAAAMRTSGIATATWRHRSATRDTWNGLKQCHDGVIRPPNLFLKQTTYETSRTDTHGIGSARSLRLKNSSQKKPSQYCDTALMRHTFRNVCTEANFGARIPILRQRVRSASHFKRRVAQLRAQTGTSGWYQHA